MPTATLASETYPNGLTVPFAPNALGQPTQVGGFATGVGDYPDGKVRQFTYGNGFEHTLTENARGLPAGITDSGAGVAPLQQTCTCDAGGNPVSLDRVAKLGLRAACDASIQRMRYARR